jgi:hypothetical protein
MATFTWYLQGGTPTTIEATDKIQFAGATFGSAINVGSYQDTTHVESNVGADDSSGNTPKNSKYLTSSTVDIGAGSVDLDSVSTANCPLKINFSHASSVTTTSAIFYAYDGTTTTAVPTDITFYAAEQGDANWTAAGGSAAALTIADDTTGTSHDYFLLISASPSAVGLKTAFACRIELVYS